MVMRICRDAKGAQGFLQQAKLGLADLLFPTSNQGFTVILA